MIPTMPLPLPGDQQPVQPVQPAQPAKPIPAGTPIRVDCDVDMDKLEEAAPKKPWWDTTDAIPEPTGEHAIPGLIWDKDKGLYHDPSGLYDVMPDLDGTLPF